MEIPTTSRKCLRLSAEIPTTSRKCVRLSEEIHTTSRKCLHLYAEISIDLRTFPQICKKKLKRYPLPRFHTYRVKFKIRHKMQKRTYTKSWQETGQTLEWTDELKLKLKYQVCCVCRGGGSKVGKGTKAWNFRICFFH